MQQAHKSIGNPFHGDRGLFVCIRGVFFLVCIYCPAVSTLLIPYALHSLTALRKAMLSVIQLEEKPILTGTPQKNKKNKKAFDPRTRLAKATRTTAKAGRKAPSVPGSRNFTATLSLALPNSP